MANIKTFVNNRLGIRYIKVSNDKILTSDGVLLEYNVIPTITPEDYGFLKRTEARYDYAKSKEACKLVLKPTKPINPLNNRKNAVVLNLTDKTKELFNMNTDLVKDTTSEEKTNANLKIKKDITLSNIFSFENVGRWFLLYVSIVCACLSIYYTSDYLYKYIGTKIIAVTLSSSMFIYSLIGLQFVEDLKRKKKKGMSFILVVTSVITIIFSMYSSADVNFTRLQKTIDIYRVENKTVILADSKKNSIDEMINLLKEEKNGLEKEKNDISSQIQYNIENDKGVRNSDLNYQLNRRNNRIKEINDKITSLTIEKMNIVEENNLDMNNNVETKPKTFYNLVGDLFGIKGEVLQMIIMMIVSVFIDIISPVALFLFRSKKL